MRLLLLALGLTGHVAAAAVSDEATRLPRPFVAAYEVSFRGLRAGTLEFKLRQTGPGPQYVYESYARPSVLARLVISSKAHESTLLEAHGSGVRPLSYRLDDGRSAERNDVALDFDWEAASVRGRAEGRTIEIPTQPGLQDRMSIQVAVQTALLRGRSPGTIAMLDGDRVKHYDYRELRRERISNPAVGQVDTVVFESSRAGSSRISRLWLAPALDYVTVRAEQTRKGKLETVMVLSSFERPDERIMLEAPHPPEG